MKKFIVDLHNYYRSRVAVGAETRGSPGPQPKAANMKELVWDEELAQIAERWARQCRFEHDVNRDVKRYGVGQNLGIRFSSRSEKANWEAVIDSWYNEVEFANRRLVQQLSSSNLSRVGHYTQMVAANTEAIGCSAVTYEDPRGRFQNTILFVCNYGPLGNFIGRPLYKIGEPCSACPSGTKCVAGGLCA
ncbi:venom allergen 3 homolog isoform X2 [Artemia franciscana]